MNRCRSRGWLTALVVCAGAALAQPQSGNAQGPPQAKTVDELLLQGRYLDIPKGKDAHGKAAWAFSRYFVAPDKSMYDAAWESHLKGDPLGTYVVMLCHQEGRAVRRDEATFHKLNFALRSSLSKKTKHTAVEYYILSKTHPGDEKGVLDGTKIDNLAEFEKADEKKRQSWLCKAWDLGLLQAAFDIGYDLQQEKKYKEAFAWYDRAAAKGLAAALRSKGYFLMEGRGTEKDEKLGFAVTHEAAKRGDPFAMGSMAFYHGTGWSTKEDKAQARAWVEKAAQTGHWIGYLELAQVQLTGKHGFAVDKKSAARNVKRALQTRNRDVLEVLTRWYTQGMGVAVDGAAAVKYGEAAFVQGSLQAPLYLHAIYKEGIGGVAKDDKLATYWGVQANPNFAFALADGLQKQYPDLTKRLNTLDPWNLD